ncbi:MAG: hypothetical protein JO182_23150 [Acidobacteriaceae bacterium]|nr:hypothetical protein [Acidobacteriaceae bacterium]
MLHLVALGGAQLRSPPAPVQQGMAIARLAPTTTLDSTDTHAKAKISASRAWLACRVSLAWNTF